LRMNGGREMKRAIIEIELIKEATDTPNEKLAREIIEELSDELHKIPWQGKIEKVARAPALNSLSLIFPLRFSRVC
jgi:hypothetical protein